LHESKLIQFLGNLPKSKKVFLLHGTVESKILYYRKLVELKLLGKNARMEMRLVPLDRGILTKEKHLLLHEMKTRSFFGEQKGILLENVSDKEAPIVLEAIESLEDDDPFLIMTAGFLNQSSKLRKSIESNPCSCSVGFYQSEMTYREIENLLLKWKIKVDENNVIETLGDFSRNYDFLEFRQELKKLALFKSSDEKPLSLEEIEKVFSSESNPNEKKLIDLLVQRHKDHMLNYFRGYGETIKNPVGFVNRAINQFKLLHKLRCHEGNTTDILTKIWPPILGKNRDRLISTSKTWKIANLEYALEILHDLDLTLRRNSRISAKSVLINGFLEICLLNN